MTGTVLCIGGSTTIGVRTTRAYPEHLGALMEGVPVANAGVMGSRLLEMLRRLPHDLFVTRPSVVLVALPPHDAMGGGTPPSELALLLGQIITWVQTAEARVVLCTPTPILGHVLPPVPPVRGFGRPSRRWGAKGKQVVIDAGEAYGLPVVDWSCMPTELMVDAIHPGPRGFSWMASQALCAVKEELEKASQKG